MTKELREKIASYRTAVGVVRAMLKNGVISAEDCDEIVTELAQFYGLSSFTIFR